MSPHISNTGGHVGAEVALNLLLAVRVELGEQLGEVVVLPHILAGSIRLQVPGQILLVGLPVLL